MDFKPGQILFSEMLLGLVAHAPDPFRPDSKMIRVLTADGIVYMIPRVGIRSADFGESAAFWKEFFKGGIENGTN